PKLLEGEPHLEAEVARILPALRLSVETVHNTVLGVGQPDVVVPLEYGSVVETGVLVRYGGAAHAAAGLVGVEAGGGDHVGVDDRDAVLIEAVDAISADARHQFLVGLADVEVLEDAHVGLREARGAGIVGRSRRPVPGGGVTRQRNPFAT